MGCDRFVYVHRHCLAQTTRNCFSTFGAGADVFGMQLEEIAPKTIERVIDAYPRLGWNQAVMELIISQIQPKPQAAAFTWMADMGRCHIHRFACPTFKEVIRNSLFDQ